MISTSIIQVSRAVNFSQARIFGRMSFVTGTDCWEEGSGQGAGGTVDKAVMRDEQMCSRGAFGMRGVQTLVLLMSSNGTHLKGVTQPGI